MSQSSLRGSGSARRGGCIGEAHPIGLEELARLAELAEVTLVLCTALERGSGKYIYLETRSNGVRGGDRLQAVYIAKLAELARRALRVMTHEHTVYIHCTL